MASLHRRCVHDKMCPNSFRKDIAITLRLDCDAAIGLHRASITNAVCKLRLLDFSQCHSDGCTAAPWWLYRVHQQCVLCKTWCVVKVVCRRDGSRPLKLLPGVDACATAERLNSSRTLSILHDLFMLYPFCSKAYYANIRHYEISNCWSRSVSERTAFVCYCQWLMFQPSLQQVFWNLHVKYVTEVLAIGVW